MIVSAETQSRAAVVAALLAGMVPDGATVKRLSPNASDSYAKGKFGIGFCWWDGARTAVLVDAHDPASDHDVAKATLAAALRVTLI